jgi:protein-S-isoprenylcysteine O-methyltransferase Ste14
VLYTAAGLCRESAAFWATIYGLGWWIVGWFAVMPPPLRFAPWAAAKDPALLLACLAFGAALAGAFTLFGLPEGSRARSNGVLGASRR